MNENVFVGRSAKIEIDDFIEGIYFSPAMFTHSKFIEFTYANDFIAEQRTK